MISNVTRCRVRLEDEVAIYDFLNLLKHGTMDVNRNQALAMFVKIICRSLREAKKIPTYPDIPALVARINELTKEYVRLEDDLTIGADRPIDDNEERPLLAPDALLRRKAVSKQMAEVYSEVAKEIEEQREANLIGDLMAQTGETPEACEINVVRMNKKRDPWQEENMLTPDELVEIAIEGGKLEALSGYVNEADEIRLYAIRTALKATPVGRWGDKSTKKLIDDTETLFKKLKGGSSRDEKE